MNLKELRKKYPKFIYQKYSYKISKNNLEILFDFRILPAFKFKPKIVIKDIDKSKIEKLGDRVLKNLIFHLGLIEVLSYWKATCSPIIEIKAGFLNSKQIKWWKDLIISGMGQFFYENKIDWRLSNFLKINQINARAGSDPALLTFQAKGGQTPLLLRDRYLIPIGGGKDSIVTLELLKKANDINCFSLNPTSATQKIIKIGGCKKPIIVKRKVDKRLLDLNQKGFLNGHTPFSAYLAFLTFLCSAIFDYKYIVLSNERSSNEGNVKYLGKTINHQWSKSFEFEKKFRKYSKKYLVKNIEYFSFLRPLYEIQIAKLFSSIGFSYFSSFLSCNVAYQTASGTKKPINKWCGNCPKCLFVFVSLYPFLTERQLLKIFNRNLFENKSLLPIMRQLIGEKGFKPFECVGTEKESLIAFYLSFKKHKSEKGELGKLPFLLEYFKKKILLKHQNLEKESRKMLNSWNKQHSLPKNLNLLRND